MSGKNKTKVVVLCEAYRDGQYHKCKNFAMSTGDSMNGHVPCKHAKELTKELVLCIDREASRDALINIGTADFRRVRSRKMEL